MLNISGFFGLPRNSILARIVTLSGGLIALVVVTYGAVFLVSDQQRGQQDLLRNARTFSLFATPSVYQDYIQFYTHPTAESFQNFVTRASVTLGNSTDLASARLVAANGKVLFDSMELRTGKYAGPDRYVDDAGIAPLIQAGVVAQRTDAPDADLQFVVPVTTIGGGRVFAMVYSFSTASLRTRLLSLLLQAVLISLPLIAIGLALPVLLFAPSIRPLRRLRDAAQRIGGGDFEADIPVEGHDEVAVLAAAFRQMLADLKKSRAELVGKISELERINKVMIDRELRMVELKQQVEQQAEPQR